MDGADYTDFERNIARWQEGGNRPPVVPVIPVTETPPPNAPDTRPTSTVVGRQGAATVVQHPGSQSVVGEQGLRDLGISKANP
jgi:hypothetical protein